MQFQKIFIPTPLKIIGNSDGVGVLKAKIFEGKYGAKLGGGREELEPKTFPGGGVWIVSGTTQYMVPTFWLIVCYFVVGPHWSLCTAVSRQNSRQC